MSTTALIMDRFNADELAVRRLLTRVPAFAALCEDYATACCALARWSEDENKAADYKAIIEELEREISGFLIGSNDTGETG
ncbi:hypothetical protein FMN50_27490 [Rhodobacterales bacterium]|nr:hypothetical protein FMN50_27490 [Rhodobacterales bacterium]